MVRRVGDADVAADRPAVLHLDVGDRACGLGQDRSARGDLGRAHELAVREHRADLERRAVRRERDRAQLLEIGQVDQHLGRGGALFHDAHERLATGQRARPVVGTEQAHGLVDRARTCIGDFAWQHAFDHIHESRQLVRSEHARLRRSHRGFRGQLADLGGPPLPRRLAGLRARARTTASAARSAPSRDLTEPGFTHEVLSSWHPLFMGSAAYAELAEPLAAHGLEYLNTEHPTGSLFPDGSAAFLSTSLDENIAELERHAAGDGAAWKRQFEEFMGSAELSFGVLSSELWSLQGLSLARSAYRKLGRRGLLAFGGGTLASARDWLEATFASDAARGLLAPWVLHTGLGPEQAVSGLHDAGDRLRGAARRHAGAEGRRHPARRGARGDRARGRGELRTGADVQRILVSSNRATGVELAGGEVVLADRAVIASVTPTQLYGRLLDRGAVPASGRALGRGLPLRPSGHADPPGAERAARVGVERGRAPLEDRDRARHAGPRRRSPRRQRGRPRAAAGRGHDRRRPALRRRPEPRARGQLDHLDPAAGAAAPRARRRARPDRRGRRHAGPRSCARPTPIASSTGSARRSRTSSARR